MSRYRGDDEGYYYVRDDLPDGQVVWAAENDANTDPGGFEALDYESGFLRRHFVNVFIGQRQGAGSITGDWFDVPKGNAQGTGPLALRPEGDGYTIEPGAYGASHLTPEAGAPWSGYMSGVTPIQPRFQGAASVDLTGTWSCDDGGTYYIRHVGDRVVWFGESQDDAAFANVFDGEIRDNVLRGTWADVPKRPTGATNGQGTLTLTLLDASGPGGWSMTEGLLRRDAQSGGFGGSLWTKTDFSHVQARLDRFTVVRRTEDSGAEPYMWLICGKVDGDTVDFNDPDSARISLGTASGHHGNITSDTDVHAGTFDIDPEIGVYTTTLRILRNVNPSPVLPGLNPQGWSGIFACVVGWDRDEFTASLAEDVFDEVLASAEDSINELIGRSIRQLDPQTGADVQDAIEKGLREDLPAILVRLLPRHFGNWLAAIDPDDRIGIDTFWGTLGNVRGQTMPILFDLGAYRVTGSITAS